MSLSRKWKGTLAAAAAVGLTGILTMAWLVDDWRRDFTQNRAATSNEAADPALRPLEARLPPVEVARLVEQAVADLPRWSEVSRRETGGSYEIQFARRTRWLGFVDDITVRIESIGGGSRVHAESQSRVGRGDLGQNPRNLKELLKGLEDRLAATGRP